MITVNCVDISKMTMEDYEKFYLISSEERKKKANRYKNLENAKRCILGDVLLQYSLIETIGYPLEPMIEYGTHGKPYVKNVENFFFNISHSGKWVVIAFGVSELGVDIEKIRWNFSLERIINRFYTGFYISIYNLKSLSISSSFSIKYLSI